MTLPLVKVAWISRPLNSTRDVSLMATPGCRNKLTTPEKLTACHSIQQSGHAPGITDEIAVDPVPPFFEMRCSEVLDMSR